MSEHSLLPPSSAARRVACPGSRALEALIPNEESESSREGTAAHWVAALHLAHPFPPKLGDTATNGETVTKEMIDGAELYCKTIFSYSVNCKELFIEERVDISDVHPKCWGTPDCWYYDEVRNVLHVFDYKFGHGYVEVFENYQLLEYAIGIAALIVPALITKAKINLVIIQPRYFGEEGKVRTWEITYDDLAAYRYGLQQSEDAAMQPKAKCKVSRECKNCSARHICSTLQAAALDTVDISKTNIPFNLTPEQVGVELRTLQRAADQLNARITGLEAEAVSLLKAGKRVDNFILKQGQGRQVWKAPISQVLALGQLFNKNIAKMPDAVTPKQAIDLGIDESIVNELSEVVRGSFKLAPADTKATRKLFGSK